MATEYAFDQPDVPLDPRAALASEAGGFYSPSRARSGHSLPLEARMEPSSGAWAGGWEICLPVRAEHVSTAKRTVVVEEVVVRRRSMEEVVRLEDTIQQERPRLEIRGDLEATRPIDVDAAYEDTGEWTRPIRRRPHDSPEP